MVAYASLGFSVQQYILLHQVQNYEEKVKLQRKRAKNLQVMSYFVFQ